MEKHFIFGTPDKKAIIDYLGNKSYRVTLEVQPDGSLWVEVLDADSALVLVDTIVKDNDNDNDNDNDKLEKYRAGKYKFPAPPVCTAYWDDAAWVAWIDSHGEWL